MSSKDLEKSTSDPVEEIKQDLAVLVRNHNEKAKATATALRGLLELDEARDEQMKSLVKTNRMLILSVLVILITLVTKVIS